MLTRRGFLGSAAAVVAAGTVARTDPMEAAARDLKASVPPTAPRATMEPAIARAYAPVPGYEAVYMDSVCVDGRWYDLVQGFETPVAKWSV